MGWGDRRGRSTIKPAGLELLDDVLGDLGDQLWGNGIRSIMLRFVERRVDSLIDRLLRGWKIAHGHARPVARHVRVLSRSVLVRVI